MVTTATAPAIAPRTEVAADESVEGDRLPCAVFRERDAAARAAVFRFAALRVAAARFALDFLVVRRADGRAPFRVRFADDRFDADLAVRFATSAPW